MKFKSIFVVVALTAALLAVSTRVFAGPAATVDAKKTPGPMKTPGAVATQKADERATRQAGKLQGKHENFKGTIVAVDAASLTLKLTDDSSVTINLTAETRIRVPSMKGATFAALAPGMTVMVQAIRDKDGVLTARAVVVIPGKPILAHRVGIVSAYEPGVSISIQAKDGNTYTFLVTSETKILPAERADQLAVGTRVTIIAPRNVTSSDWTARGIVIHPPGNE